MQYACRNQLFLHQKPNFSAFLVNCFRPCNEHNIITSWRCRQHLCSCANHSSRPVAFHCISDFFACCYPHTTNSRAVFENVGDQRRICVCFSAGICPAEITVCFQCVGFQIQVALSVRKLLSAFCSAASKNLTPVAIGHSFSETMFHFALTLFGLICSFHYNPSILSFAVNAENFPLIEKGHKPPLFLQLCII